MANYLILRSIRRAIGKIDQNLNPEAVKESLSLGDLNINFEDLQDLERILSQRRRANLDFSFLIEDDGGMDLSSPQIRRDYKIGEMIKYLYRSQSLTQLSTQPSA